MHRMGKFTNTPQHVTNLSRGKSNASIFIQMNKPFQSSSAGGLDNGSICPLTIFRNKRKFHLRLFVIQQNTLSTHELML